jgi:hypothetical protein
MPIHVDDTGYQQEDATTWVDPATGDRMTLHYADHAPNLPAPLTDLPRLRQGLAAQSADVGGLIEAHVVTVGSVPALRQIAKLPLPERPGQGFVASLTVPKAGCSAQLRFQALEGPQAGIREATVLAELGPDRYFGPHPYAPQLQGKLPWHHGDDMQWDQQFPDHPLSRARAWLRRAVETARLDPEFAALAPFAGPPSADLVHTTVEPGIPIAGYLPLWLEGRVMFWRMAEPDLVLARLGTGQLGRTQLAGNNFRETMLLGDDGHTLTMLGRYPGPDGDLPAEVTTVRPAAEKDAAAAATPDAVAEAFRWVGRAAAAAAMRGDYLAIDPGAPTGTDPEPYCTLAVRNVGDETHATIETAPVPEGAPFWSDEPGARVKGRRVDLADESEVGTQFSALGLLAMFAVGTWPVHPLRLSLSFGRNPPVSATADG